MKDAQSKIHSFSRNDSKLTSLGIGKMEIIKKWLEKVGIKKYALNDDLTIDTFDTINIGNRNIIELPSYIQFNKAHSHFIIPGNNLITLRGCPYEVNGMFGCSDNPLTSFEFCPKHISGNFGCEGTNITSFDFAPEYIGGILYINKSEFDIEDIKNYFESGVVKKGIHSPFGEISATYIDHNFKILDKDFMRIKGNKIDESFIKGEERKLDTLGIGSRRVLITKWLEGYNIKNYYINSDTTIDITGNLDLESVYLTEFPEYIQFNKVSGSVWLIYNELSSLRGCPQKIKGSFQCNHNKLSSLKYGPLEVGGNYECDHNKLTSLEFCAKEVPGDLWCGENNISSDQFEKDLRNLKIYGKIHSDLGDFITQDNLAEIVNFKKMSESFVKHADKLSSVGVGKITLIKKWLEEHRITKYSLNEDLSIDVDGSVEASKLRYGNFPEYIQFNEISGDFYCTDCQLTTLRGCPRTVHMNFGMGVNPGLNSINYVPTYVGGNFFSKRNPQLEEIITKELRHTTIIKHSLHLE